MKNICEIEDCEKPTKSGSCPLCHTHYMRQYRNGTTTSIPKVIKSKKICSVEDCEIISKCKGYCNTHYANFRRTGNPIPTAKPHRDPVCMVEGCLLKHRRNGYCEKHSARNYRHGDPLVSKNPNTHRGHVGCTIKKCTNKHFAKGLCGTHHHEKYTATIEGRVSEKRNQRKYNQTPKGKAANQLKRQRRRHLEKSHVKLTIQEVLQVKENFEHKCFNCGDTKDLTLDHHIPLIKGGELSIKNTVLLCRLCNGLKADLNPSEFYTKNQLNRLFVYFSK